MTPLQVHRRIDRCFAEKLSAKSPWHPGETGGKWRPAVPNERYHRAPGVSKSTLVRAQDTLFDALFPEEPAAGSRPALDVGSALNDALLWPRRWKRRYLRGPDDRRGNRWKQALAAAQAAGATLLTEADFSLVVKLRKAVLAHPDAQKAFEVPQAIEPTLVWRHASSGMLCRCRPDLVAASSDVVDLKSAYDGTALGFRRAVRASRYHWSVGFTTLGMRAVFPAWRGCYVFLVVDKELALRVGAGGVALYRLSFEAEQRGVEEVNQALDRLAGELLEQRERAEPWLGLPTGVNRLEVFW